MSQSQQATFISFSSRNENQEQLTNICHLKGPIVRINPYELHIDDPEFYDVLYSGPTQRRDKWQWSVNMFGTSTSVLSTIAHDHHRLRQKALLPFFSKQSVTRLEPLIQSVIDSLCANVERHRQAQKPVNLLYAFSAVSTDVIRQYSFGESTDDVEKDEFFPEWYKSVMIISELSMTLKQFGWLLPVMDMSPLWLVKRINPPLYNLLGVQKVGFSSLQQITS